MERDEKITQMLETTGKEAADSLAEMVAALNCDYDWLTEAKEERTALADDLAAADLMTDMSEVIEQIGNLNVEIADLEKAAGECTSREEAEQRIQEDALSVEVRSDWVSVGSMDELNEPEEFRVLLSTGGPASRIIGELRNGEPYRARLQVQDWGTPWVDVIGAEDDALAYASVFYFGEG